MLGRVLLVGCLFAAGAAQAADADFTLVNRTGYAINEVFISPTTQSRWGGDRLGDYQLANGEARTFRFGDTRNCVQDIKVVFTEDESEVEWQGFDLCQLHRITLYYNRTTGDVSAESE